MEGRTEKAYLIGAFHRYANASKLRSFRNCSTSIFCFSDRDEKAIRSFVGKTSVEQAIP